MGENIVNRNEWGAVAPFSALEVQNLPMKYLVYVYSDTRQPQCYSSGECSDVLQKMQQNHMKAMRMPDIAYNFIIAGDGKIYEGRGWHSQPPRFRYLHHLNRKAYMIGILGDLIDTPSEAVWNASWEILEIGIRNKYISERVILAAEDAFEKEPEPEIPNDNQAKAEPSLWVEQLATSLRPTVDLSPFWKDKPNLPRKLF